jgi:hypothetical protein
MAAMHDWHVLPELGAIRASLWFAAGAMTVTLVQCVIVACASLVRRLRPAGAYEFPSREPSLIWAELRELRAGCAASAANLETAVAKLKQSAMAQMVELGSSAHRLERLRRALDEKTSAIGALEQQRAELELLKERHLLALDRKDAELGTRSDALAAAQRTIALLRGMLGPASSAPPQASKRAAV